MISVFDAQKKILTTTVTRKKIKQSLVQSQHRLLAQDVLTTRDIPAFHRATMDGIAICEKEKIKLGQEFSLVGTLQAGEDLSQKRKKSLSKGEAVWIMTGAPLPCGASRVIPIEHLQNTLKGVRITSLTLDKCFAPKGEDAKKGQAVLTAGQVIDSRLSAFCASLGKLEVETFAPPRVAILSTGNEVVACTQTPSDYQITDLNSYLLAQCLQKINIPSQKLGIAADDKNLLRAKIIEGLEYDIFLISGSVSTGKYDLIPELLQQEGCQQIFHKVKIKPGKPLWFGKTKHSVVFGLPGNPVAVQVCYKLFVEIYIKHFLGYAYKECLPQWHLKRIIPQLTKLFPLDTYYPAKKVGLYKLKALPFRSSGDFLSLVASDGLVCLESNISTTNFKPQTFVRFLPWES